jgi:rhamnosyltransferase
MDVTVIIPTFNGEAYLAEVLDAIASQDFDGSVETLVVDSGSQDGTLEIVRSRPSVRLHEIPNSEFGHGRTRNLAARLATGDTVVFLTQDAIPAHDGWLRELVAPLDPERGGAAAVTGQQIPRPTCFPLMKYDIQSTFAAVGPPDRVTVERWTPADGEAALIARSFYSDVNAATRRAFLLDTVPLQDVPYSEDFAFAQDILRAGYAKAYAPAGSVIHSNDLTLEEYRKRIFEETIALRRLGHAVGVITRWRRVSRGTYFALRDSVRIIRDPDYGAAATLGWLVRNPRYHRARWHALYDASHVELDDHETIARGSLETDKKTAS